jgi:hypothetical protein
MVICACGLLPNPVKVPNFQLGHDALLYTAWYSMDQKFHGDDEKTRESLFWDLVQWPTAIIRPKSQNSNIRHDGILSIGNFMLMINNHLHDFSCPITCQKPKKCAPYFRGNTQFPIYSVFPNICLDMWTTRTNVNPKNTDMIKNKLCTVKTPFLYKDGQGIRLWPSSIFWLCPANMFPFNIDLSPIDTDLVEFFGCPFFRWMWFANPSQIEDSNHDKIR